MVVLIPTKVQETGQKNMGKGGEYAPSELEGEAAGCATMHARDGLNTGERWGSGKP